MYQLFRQTLSVFFLLFCLAKTCFSIPEAALHVVPIPDKPNSYAITFDTPEGWHLYAPDSTGGIPLSFTLKEQDNLDAIHPYTFDWPKGKLLDLKGEEASVYIDMTTAYLTIHPKEGKHGYLKGVFQGGLCKDMCIPFQAELSIGNPPSPFYEILWYILMALLGGLLLNIMPCVWPILFTKFRALKNKTNGSHRKKLFLTFLGILAFFNLLAIVALAFQNVSDEYLWGSHFQNPYFLGLLTLVIGLAGVAYTLPVTLFTSLQSYADKVLRLKALNHGHDFFLGFLAGILASPCTAPFLTAALAFSISQPPLFLLLFFNAIAMGYGLPYLLLMLTSRVADFLPKPGAWMVFFERIAGVSLIVVAIWLGYATYSSWHSTENTSYASQNAKYAFYTEHFSPDRIPRYLQEGKNVFVIITAPWCLTCKYNEYGVFTSGAVVTALNKPNWVVMVGVWENGNRAVTKYLKSVSSPGVPTYRAYGKAYPSGHPIPEVPSVDDILQTMDKVSK